MQAFLKRLALKFGFAHWVETGLLMEKEDGGKVLIVPPSVYGKIALLSPEERANLGVEIVPSLHAPAKHLEWGRG